MPTDDHAAETLQTNRFRKKPVVIEAVQWTGANVDEVLGFILARGSAYRQPSAPQSIFIDTLEGTMRADKGDWIIRGVKGEFYPCKSDIFAETYEPVEAAALLSQGRGIAPTDAERRRAEVVMSWSTTQRAVYNRLGQMATMTPEEQEAMRLRMERQVELAGMSELDLLRERRRIGIQTQTADSEAVMSEIDRELERRSCQEGRTARCDSGRE